MKIYKAINAVQTELSTIGITKDRTNSQGSGYKFRGIDDVYNAIAPLLAKHGLCILPRVLNRECVERSSKAGAALFYVTVEVEFDFVAAEDGSKHTVKTFGEAMDSSDKATNKAMSAAYKYAAFQAFSIPTESDNDADAFTHVVQSPEPNVTDATINALLDDIVCSNTIEQLKESFDIAIKTVGKNQIARDQIAQAKDAQKATLKGTP